MMEHQECQRECDQFPDVTEHLIVERILYSRPPAAVSKISCSLEFFRFHVGAQLVGTGAGQNKAGRDEKNEGEPGSLE